MTQKRDVIDKGARDDRWYFSLMAPNTKGDKFAWLDPTSIYINGEAFHDLLDDLCAELDPATIDVVAGLDAMGFVLGSGIATRLGRGFLPIRKAGKLCVDTDSADYTNYTGRSQSMEMRLPAFNPGTRVLLVDQWVETGGSMHGAIQLVEQQKGLVAGLVTIVMETNENTRAYREKYHCVTAILPETEWQRQADTQYLECFKTYSPESAFPV